MINLLTFKYWFNLSPELFTMGAQTVLIILFSLLFLFGMFFMVLKRKSGPYKILALKLYDFCWVNFFIGCLLFFFSSQGIYFFSARFWYLLWIALMVYWLLDVRNKFKKIKEKRGSREKETSLKKYLP